MSWDARGSAALPLHVPRLTCCPHAPTFQVTEGKFTDALRAFTRMLHVIPLTVVESRKEVDEVKELITICKVRGHWP